MDTYFPGTEQGSGVYWKVVGRSLYAGGLVALTGALAWVLGRPFVFPSLGPTAYLLATAPRESQASARRVLGGHLVGVVAGMAAYYALAPGLVITAEAPVLARAQLRLAASGVVAVALTTGGMLATETVHPPACATTLIVALGLLSSPADVAVIPVAVAVVFSAHAAASRAGVV